MKYVLTNEEMRAADRYTIEGGVPALSLMERAGLALANEAERMAPTGTVLCVCGGGNNGGDGFVCARLLKERGREISVVCFAEKYSAECRGNRERYLALGGEIFFTIPDGAYALVVDCLFGTGFHGEVKGEAASCVDGIAALRARGAKVLACDIPSGVNGENGKLEGVAVRADVTLCIGERKAGAYFGDGIDCVGEVKRADIGIALPKKDYAFLTETEEAQALLPTRRRNSHKGSYGRAAIVAGSMEYTGAAYLSTAACLRSGAGYTSLFLPKELLPFYILKAPEALLRTTNEGGRYAFNAENMQELLEYDSVAYGMGMGVSREVFLGAKWLIENYEGKLILDADGLSSLAKYADLSALFAKKKCEVLLTPHGKEFSRLTGIPVLEISPIDSAKTLAKEWGVTVLLKNAVTVVTDGRRVSLNATGNSGQAKGGTGDVLSGVLVGLCAQGLSAFDGGRLGSYLVGRAAEIVAKEREAYSLTASDILAHLGAYS